MTGPVAATIALPCWLLLASLGAPAHADVQTRIEQARLHTESGLTAQRAGNYAEAIAQYTLAYEQVPHPDMLYNFGQVHRLSGDLARAKVYYEQYLAIQPQGRRAAEARRWLTALEPELVRAQAEAARQEEARRLALEEELRARDAAAALERQQRERAQKEEARRVAQEVTQDNAPQRRGRGLGPRREAALVVGGISLLALGAGAGFELSARSLDEQYDDGGRMDGALHDSAARRHTLALTFSLTGVGGAGLATYLWLTGGATRAAPPRATLTPLVAPGARGVALSGTF